MNIAQIHPSKIHWFAQVHQRAGASDVLMALKFVKNYFFSLNPRAAHAGGQMFQLWSDLMIMNGKSMSAVLNGQWKRLNDEDKSNKYGFSQSVFHQLFAYGPKYWQGRRGRMLLIYPKTSRCTAALPSLRYTAVLTLWFVPFDLENENLDWPEEVKVFCSVPELDTNPWMAASGALKTA